jgi:adenylyltransferase and sulfurtransferase
MTMGLSTRLNSHISVTAIPTAIGLGTLRQLSPPLSSYDLVLDCTDNAPTRYFLNDACVQEGKTLVSGAAIRAEGWNVVWNLDSPSGQSLRGPCYRCVFPEPDTPQEGGRCEDEGVLGVVPGVIGVLMACEAVKLLTGLHGTLWSLAHSIPELI